MSVNGNAQQIIDCVVRNEFGALVRYSDAAEQSAQLLLKAAIKAGKLDAEYNHMEWHKRHGYIGWCLNYDIYDVTAAAVLVQRRKPSARNTAQARTRTITSFDVAATAFGLKAAKSWVVKLAKLASKLGEVIDTLEGRSKTPLKQIAPCSSKSLANQSTISRRH